MVKACPAEGSVELSSTAELAEFYEDLVRSGYVVTSATATSATMVRYRMPMWIPVTVSVVAPPAGLLLLLYRRTSRQVLRLFVRR